MVNYYALDSKCPVGQKGNKFYAGSSKLIKGFVLFIAFIFSGGAFAQQLNNFSCDISKRNPCTSKDLEVVDAFVEGANDCLTCTIGDSVTKKLFMTIINKTGSTRQAFALFGTLNGGRVLGQTGSKIFLCVGPIQPNSTQTFEAGMVRFKCGDRLTLTDNFLAWVDASGTKDQRCAEFQAATKCSDIAPKCGTSAEIVIRTALSATARTLTEPCIGATTGGSIRVVPTGGVRRYTIVIAKAGAGDCPATPAAGDIVAGNTTTKVDSLTTGNTLAAGTYCCYVTDSAGCTFTFKHTIAGVQCCQAPPKPCITATTAGICSNGTVSLTVSNAVNGDKYFFVRGSTKDSVVASGGTATFTGITPSTTDFKVYGVDEVGGTRCTSDTSRCADLDQTCVGNSTARRAESQVITLDEAQTKVVAAPNPFNDRIRFSLQSAVSGQGSLELYNMLGQKVKTVFQGKVEAGKVHTIEYSVPGSQRANLIYLFRVGNQKTSGKLIGLR